MKKFVMVVIALLYSFIGVNMVFADTWTQKADFGGTERFFSVGFSIGNKGYIGTGGYIGPPSGVSNVSSPHTLFKDFWEYDPANDTWTQKADFEGAERWGAVGFSIGNKGYIGTGPNCKDFWEYDPYTNIWTRKADFGGGERVFAFSFSIGGKGYIGAGTGVPGVNDADVKDFWEYDPTTDTWTRKADIIRGGPSCAGFSIGSKGYASTLVVSEDSNNNLFEYDQPTDTWTRKADFGGPVRAFGVFFSIGSKGYLGMGVNYTTLYDDFWEYDPTIDTWTRKADVGGAARNASIGFSIGDKGYIGTGWLGNPNYGPYGLGMYTKDFWEYDPGILGCTTPPVISSLTASPNTHMVPVTVRAVVSDACGDPSPETKIISVMSNHPPNSDAVANGQAVITGNLTLNLLAARPNWRQNERVYTITVQSQDSFGNVATGTVTVRERNL